MTFDPADKIVVVTGASRGLGWALATEFGLAGAHVVAVARTVGGLEELDDHLQSNGKQPATLVPLDLTDSAGVDRLGAALHQRWGKIDLLLHCAAQSSPLSPVTHIDRKDLDRVINNNIVATWSVLRSLGPLLSASGQGRAIFTHDRHVGGPFWGSYGCTKAAADFLIRSFAHENADKIKTAFFAPPLMPTALRMRMQPGLENGTIRPPKAAGRLYQIICDDRWANHDMLSIDDQKESEGNT